MLTVEDLQRLEVCLPTAQELKTVFAYTGTPAALGPAETFFRALGGTPRVAQKVSAMLFSRVFFGSVAGDAETRVETLTTVRRSNASASFSLLSCCVAVLELLILVFRSFVPAARWLRRCLYWFTGVIDVRWILVRSTPDYPYGGVGSPSFHVYRLVFAVLYNIVISNLLSQFLRTGLHDEIQLPGLLTCECESVCFLQRFYVVRSFCLCRNLVVGGCRLPTPPMLLNDNATGL